MINVKDRLLLQKNEIEERRKESYLEREQTLKDVEKRIIQVVLGPRRSGKSTFVLHELLKGASFGYGNFDDEDLVEMENYDELIEKINLLYDKPRTLFLDEVQNLKKWELFVNRLQRRGFNLVVSGSNANILSKEMATHLTGRHLSLSVFPLSFCEFLGASGESELTDAESRAQFDKYLEWGGYPEPLAKKLNYKDYLSTLFDSVIYKDIVKRFRIRNPSALENLALFVISHISNKYSYTTLAEVTNTKSPPTVEKYLAYLEEAFLIFRIPRFSKKIKNQIRSDKKIYCIDNGLISAKSFKIFDRPSNLYENVVAIKLWKRFSKDLFYYRSSQGDYEVDFVIRKGNKITQLIQVCYSLDDQKTRMRELRALVSGSKDLGCDHLTVLTDDYESEETFEWFGEKRKLSCIPVWRWLQEPLQ